MTKMKKFHLYAKLDQNRINTESILLPFTNEFWLHSGWSFGMHRKYFYTLPFHFDYIYEFDGGFNDVKSNNDNILINDPRIWYNVKSIELAARYKYNLNFIKQLKMKMPKLTLIRFGEYYFKNVKKIEDQYISNDETEENYVTLDNVKTIQCTWGTVEDEKEWLINVLPNFKRLTLSTGELPSINSELTRILNERIEQLNIYTTCNFKQLTETSYIYFSNVQCINFCLQYHSSDAQRDADVVMKILKNFENLKILIIHILQFDRNYMDSSKKTDLSQLIKRLDMNEIVINYQVKHFSKYSLFSKK